MKINIREKEFKIWLVVSILIVIVWSAVIWMLLEGREDNQASFLEEELKRFEGEVNSTLITYEEFSNYIFDEINKDQEILSIMDQANTASVQEKYVESMRQPIILPFGF